MSKTDARTACNRLVVRLERAARLEPDARDGDRFHEPLLRFVASLFRMRIRPALEDGWLWRDPVHLSLLGGTNTGKSTLLNVFLGRPAAGMDVTARYSQHPEGYRLPSLGSGWLDDFPTRFRGYARHEDEHAPRQTDPDLESRGYRPALALLDPLRDGGASSHPPASTTAVFWDAPDFSTEQSRHWIDAVLDTVALADIVVLAVTDESYADDRACTLLGLVSEAGISLHVVANKVAADGNLPADIRKKLDLHWRGSGDGLPSERFHRLGFVDGGDSVARLACLLDSAEAEALRRTLADQVALGLPLKRANLAGNLRFLEQRLDDILEPVAAEARQAREWGDVVRGLTDRELLGRYRTDYLDGERYGEFNQTLVRLMERLEVPGIGEVVKMLGQIVRVPVTMLTGLVRRILGSGNKTPAHTPEHEVLAKRFAAWIAALRSDVQVRSAAGGHAGWSRVAERLGSEAFVTSLTDRLENAYAEYRPAIEREVSERAKEIYDAIASRPVLVNALRGTNLAVDTAAVILVVKSGGLNWSDAIVGPAVAGLRRILLESGLEKFLTQQERRLKETQFELMDSIVRTHLEEPVRALFEAGFEPGEVQGMREDFAVVRDAIHGTLSEEDDG